METVLERDLAWLVENLLAGSFEISLTAPGGWHAVKHYSVTGTEGNDEHAGRLAFTVALPAQAPRVSEYDPDVHDGNWHTRSPAIRFRLGEHASFCAYSLFCGLTVRR